MGRVADALKRSGQLQRDRPEETHPVLADFRSEPASPQVQATSALAGVLDLPRGSVAHVGGEEPNAVGEGTGRRLVGHFEDPLVEEEYRMLGAALHRAQERSGIRSVLITSALPREGKTLSAANMAIILSRSYGRRVLLIDADLRKPAVHDLFGVSQQPGLSDALRSGAPVAPTQVRPRLWLVPAGTLVRHSEQLLAGDGMKRLLSESSQEFDWVLIDTPPAGVLPVADLLLGSVDCAIMVVRAGKTPHGTCQRTVAAFLESGKLLGAILNGGGARHHRGYYASYSESNV